MNIGIFIMSTVAAMLAPFVAEGTAAGDDKRLSLLEIHVSFDVIYDQPADDRAPFTARTMTSTLDYTYTYQTQRDGQTYVSTETKTENLESPAEGWISFDEIYNIRQRKSDDIVYLHDGRRPRTDYVQIGAKHSYVGDKVIGTKVTDRDFLKFNDPHIQDAVFLARAENNLAGPNVTVSIIIDKAGFQCARFEQTAMRCTYGYGVTLKP